MDKIHARFQQLRTRMRERGVSIKATMAEMIGTASFVLIGLLTIVYASEGISGECVPGLLQILPRAQLLRCSWQSGFD